MRILTYNIHSCVGMDSQISAERIARVIAQAAPDVVCLQEVDVGRRRTRLSHQAGEIARQLAMRFHFHPAMRVAEEEYGEAILTSHPLRLVQAARLPTVRSLIPVEPRGILHVAVEVEGIEWHVMNTHFGLGRAERQAQARAVVGADWLGAVPPGAPLVLCGDFNSRPASRTIDVLRTRLREGNGELGQLPAATFSTSLPVLCLDYFFLGESVRVSLLEVVDSPLSRVASDHFPVLGDFSTR